jgi:hypothetical protein
MDIIIIIPRAGILAPVLRVNRVSDMVFGCNIKSGVFLSIKFARAGFMMRMSGKELPCVSG